MADNASGGWVRKAARSAASTRSWASVTGICTDDSGATPSSTRASASATGSRVTSCLRGAPMARYAPALLDQANAFDTHAALDRLDHVVDGQARDRRRGQRLHLDAGAAGDAHAGAHDDARELGIRHEVDIDLRDVERVAQRDQLVGSFRRHDAGDARGTEHVAL